MDIVFNTWFGAFFHPGGGEVQLIHSRNELIKKGLQVDLFNHWSPQKKFDIFHQFSLIIGVEQVLEPYRRQGKKIALSTIYWHEPEKNSSTYQYIRHLFSFADILFTNSDAESQKLSRAFDISLNKFHKTRNGITSDFLKFGNPNIFRKQYNINTPFVLSLANIDRRKNTDKLLEACKAQNIPLITIGHIRDAEYFESFKNNYSHYKHLGPISDVEMIKSALLNCEVFALPSLCETPGIAALEAASQGCKILITQEGPTKEYFGSENATFVDPNSLESIINGLRHELSLQKRKSIAEHIATQFTWEKAAEDILEGYKKIL